MDNVGWNFDWQAARIEAEVSLRKNDEALIRQMLAALERCRFDSLNMTIKDMQECGDAVTAARARLEKAP